MKRYAINLPLFILTQIGWWTSAFLSYKQISTGNFCPELFNISTAYLSLAIFTLIFISFFLKKLASQLLFYLPAWLGLFMAYWFSCLQFTDQTPFIMHCPQFFNLPTCYLSLGLLVVMLIVKIISDKRH